MWRWSLTKNVGVPFTPLRAPPTKSRWIRSRQRADGTWAAYHGGPGELSVTVEAYIALRLAGDPSDEPHMRRAAEFVDMTVPRLSAGPAAVVCGPIVRGCIGVPDAGYAL